MEGLSKKEKQLEREEKKKYAPYKFSGKSYSFDITHEKGVLDNIRSWSQDYFSNNMVVNEKMYMLLKDVKHTQ
jgi:hypothetical protein